MQLDAQLAAPLAALLVGFALCGWAVWAYRRTLTPIGPARRRLLLALRLAASLLLALMLGGLDLVLERPHSTPPLLRVLVDASASMERPAGADSTGPSRYAGARALVDDVARRYRGRLRVEPAAFGMELREGELPARATAPLTDLGGALAALPPAEPGEALLLLSDGCDTEGGLWSSALERGRPIFAMALGDSVAPPDLRIDRVDALSVLRKGSRLPLTVDIAATGVTARQGRLRVTEGGRELAARDWLLEPGETGARLDLSLELDGVGEHMLELALEHAGPDAAPGNDRRLLAVRVVESKLRVLVLAGRPDWDLSALMDGLRGEEALDLRLVTAGPDGGLRESPSGRPWTPEGGAGADGSDNGEIHGLVLHSWAPQWDPALLERLPLRGGVLIMDAFLARPGRARLPARWRVDVPGMAPPRREQVLDWGPDATRHPALQGALTLGIAPSALPAMVRVDRNPLADGRVLLAVGDVPVLAARELGGQRTVAASGEGFWRWRLQGDDGRLLYAELFSGLLRWVAREDPPGRLLVDWGDEPLMASQPGRLHAEVFDPDFRPVAGAALDWSLSRGDSLLAGGSFQPEAAAEGYAGQLPALPSGVYRLGLTATLPGGEQLSRRLELPVQPPRRELRELAARPETLRWLAARSGGELLAVGDLDGLDAALDFTPRASVARSVLRLWQHPLAFLLLLALLGLEWGLRKRFGMV